MWETIPGPTAHASYHADRADGVLRLAGEIDQDNAVAVADRIVTEVAAGVAHLDLSAVSFFGAAGLRALLTGLDALPPGVDALQVTCSPLVLRVLRACGLVAMDRLSVVAACERPARSEAPA